MDAEYFALKGLDKLNLVISEVKKLLNPKIEMSGVVITKFDERLLLHKGTIEILQKYIP